MAGIWPIFSPVYSPRARDLFPMRESPKASETGRRTYRVDVGSPRASESGTVHASIIQPLTETQRPSPTARPTPTGSALGAINTLA